MQSRNLFFYILSTYVLFSSLIIPQEKGNYFGIHYNVAKDINYTDFSLLGVNLFYEYKLNKKIGIRSNLNINHYYFERAGQLGGRFERLESAIFFSIEEAVNYYLGKKWNGFTPYLSLGIGYFLFDNYLSNHPNGSVYNEYLIDNFGYHILGGILNEESGFSISLKYSFIPTQLFQNKSIISAVQNIDVKRSVGLNIFTLGVGYIF